MASGDINNEDDDSDGSVTYHGPRFLKVYVPPKPPPHPDDFKQDWPPGEPPEVHYMDFAKNLWMVLEEGTMPSYHNSERTLKEDQMEWLRQIAKKIDPLAE